VAKVTDPFEHQELAAPALAHNWHPRGVCYTFYIPVLATVRSAFARGRSIRDHVRPIRDRL